ncbi:MAG TPA: hypothetical protein VMJ34_09750 [Bryobacteraceae bacterium]|nr:hypothetical protein [Bryobacteraceae bacterium]
MPDATPVRTAFKVFRWGALILLGLIIGLALRKSPPPAVEYDPQASARVEQKLAAADQATAAGQPAQVQIDRTELNSYLQQNLQTSGSPASAPAPAAGAAAAPSTDAKPGSSNAPLDDTSATLEQVQSSVKDVKVDMDGDLVKAYVVFDFHGKDLSLELDGHLVTQGGYMKFEPVAGKLGSLPLPQATLDAAVDKLMASPENREKLKLPAGVNDIKIQDGQAVVSYK